MADFLRSFGTPRPLPEVIAQLADEYAYIARSQDEAMAAGLGHGDPWYDRNAAMLGLMSHYLRLLTGSDLPVCDALKSRREEGTLWADAEGLLDEVGDALRWAADEFRGQQCSARYKDLLKQVKAFERKHIRGEREEVSASQTPRPATIGETVPAQTRPGRAARSGPAQPTERSAAVNIAFHAITSLKLNGYQEHSDRAGVPCEPWSCAQLDITEERFGEPETISIGLYSNRAEFTAALRELRESIDAILQDGEQESTEAEVEPEKIAM